MNLSERSRVDKELFSGERNSYENTMNLSGSSCVDKELFSGERRWYENTKTYTLYEKINIKLWVFTSFENIFDKLKIEIM